MQTRPLFPGLVVLAGLLAIPALARSSEGDRSSHADVPVFGAESSMVQLDVVVRDRDGDLVRDLTAADFEVFEDGQRQEVAGFTVFDSRPRRPAGTPAQKKSAEPDSPVPPEADASAAGADALARPLRPGVIAFVFDRLSPGGRDIAYRATQVYANRGHVPGDFVAVFAMDLALHTIQSFTNDLPQIRAAFERIGRKADTEFASSRQESRDKFDEMQRIESVLMTLSGAEASSMASALALELELTQMEWRMLQSYDRLERDQQGHASTNGLMGVVEGLRALPGRKTVIFFSEGLSLPSTVLSQFRSVVATANRWNVSVYAVDVGGLRTESGIQEARAELARTSALRLRQERSGRVEAYSGALTRVLEQAEDMLRLNPSAGLSELAEGTGGFLVADTNDASSGFERIQEEMRFYYLLSYAPTNASFDGRFRQINVKVKRPGLKVQSRKGYLAVRSQTTVPVRTFEAPVIAQLDRSPRPDDFPLRATALVFPERERPGRVPVLVEMSARDLTFRPSPNGDEYAADFSIVARVRDEKGLEMDRLSQHYNLTVPAERIEAARAGGVLFFQETDLPAGRYTLDAAAYDALGAKGSVRTVRLDVPEVRPGGPRLSSLVLLKKAERLKPEELSEDNPLHVGEVIVYPNLGESFRKSAMPAVGFFFSAYTAEGEVAPERATIELFDGEQAALRTTTPLAEPDEQGRIQHAAALPLETLHPGEYTLRVTVASGSASATQQARLAVAP